MVEPLSYSHFVAQVARSRDIWIEGLSPGSWRLMASTRVADRLGKDILGGTLGGKAADKLLNGSTANFLSRIYLDPVSRGVSS
jgi:hypothetical protein